MGTDLTSDAMLNSAFSHCPREWFLTPEQRPHAALDQALPLMLGQTCSQPSTVRTMLQLLGVRPGQRILDVGSGSGWTTALLGHLVGRDGYVRGLEREPELVSFGRTNLQRTGLAHAEIQLAELGLLGAPQAAPWQRILVSAMAEELPQDLRAQLSPTGVMVIPVAGRLLRVTPTEVDQHGYYRFVPLR